MKQYAIRIASVNRLMNEYSRHYANDPSCLWPGRYIWPRTDYPTIHSFGGHWKADAHPYLMPLEEAWKVLKEQQARTSGFSFELVCFKAEVIKMVTSLSKEEAQRYWQERGRNAL